MLSTVEVRWFFRGAVPPDIWEWFHAQGSEPEEQPPRVDYYLRIPDADSLGVKLREGRIEVKQRTNQPEVARFGKRAVGNVEHWCKWSFELDETSEMIAELSGNPLRWIGVRKERKLRTYQVTDDKTMIEAPNSTNMDQGCGWEVAKVSVDKSEWWSLGFEAFGKESERWPIMMLVAEYYLSMDGCPILALADSYGYPRWLQNVGRIAQG